MSAEEQPPKKIKMTTETTSRQDTGATTLTCAHWVKRKKRYCKMTVANNKEYCGEHTPAFKNDSIEEPALNCERIYCPFDGGHTVYKNKLNKHLKICNARPRDDLPEYIQKNINFDDNKEEPTQEDLKNIKLKDLDDTEFYQVIDKVKELYKKFVENKIERLECHHKCMDVELEDEKYGKESRKHLIQSAALLGILENEKKITDSTSFIEFGAGKGQLAAYLAKLLETKQNSEVVLVDRMSLRHKKDNKIEDRSLVHRLRADIADFCLDKLSILKNPKHCVAVSKHLCGGATDLTLRCIIQSKETLTDLIMIALCCHHRCDWHSFVGKDFLKEHRISQREFVIITKMVGWAICGTGMSREKRKALEEQKLVPQEIAEINRNPRLPLAERQIIGFMCKRVLDYARLGYIKKHAYNAELYYFVSKDVTLENVVLLAKKIVKS